MAQWKKRSRSEDNIGYTEAAKRPKIMPKPTAAERDESIAEDIRANKGWEDDDSEEEEDDDSEEEEDDDSEEEEDKEEEDQTNGLTRCKNTLPVTIPITMPVWKKCSFEEAYNGGEDTYFKLESMGGSVTFSEGGVWEGLTDLDADASGKFLMNLSEHFLKTEIAKQLSLRPLHFKDGDVRVVGWHIADSMVNYC